MSIHDPRTWHWPEGMPISLQGQPSPPLKLSVPDKRDNRDPEELGNAILYPHKHTFKPSKYEQLDFGDDWQLKGYDA